MAKLINLNVLDAKDVICVWREDGVNADCDCGIALDDAVRNFIVPRYVAVGVFDNGTTKAGGLMSLDVFNEEDGNIFLYDEFLHTVDSLYAKAFVRGTVLCGEYRDEKSAREGIYEELLGSGVRITEKAVKYFTEDDNS